MSYPRALAGVTPLPAKRHGAGGWFRRLTKIKDLDADDSLDWTPVQSD